MKNKKIGVDWKKWLIFGGSGDFFFLIDEIVFDFMGFEF